MRESLNTVTRYSSPSISCVLPPPQCYLASWSAHSSIKVSQRRLLWNSLWVDWKGILFGSSLSFRCHWINFRKTSSHAIISAKVFMGHLLCTGPSARCQWCGVGMRPLPLESFGPSCCSLCLLIAFSSSLSSFSGHFYCMLPPLSHILSVLNHTPDIRTDKPRREAGSQSHHKHSTSFWGWHNMQDGNERWVFPLWQHLHLF